MEKFSKLRFHEFTKAAAAGVIAGAIALHPAASMANTGAKKIVAGSATWYVNTNITFQTTSSNWGFSSATLHTASGARSGAYKGALSWLVNVGAPNNPHGGYVDPGGVVDMSGTPTTGVTVDGGTQSLAGLNVHGQLYFAASKAVARSIVFLQNPTSAAITVSVENATDQGSGDITYVQATSSGGTSFSYANDHWVVISSGASPPANSGPPITTYALSESGASAQATGVVGPTNGNRDFYWVYSNVTVPAGQTRALMVFSQMSGTVAGAETDAANFNSAQALESAGFLAGLSGVQRTQILNWNIPLPQPTLAWTAPATITYGMPLSATQLDATASYNSTPVAGTFTYTPPAGTVLNAGPNQTLSATFVPTDTANYGTPASPVTTTITVLQASTTATPVPPASASVGSPATISANVAVVSPGAGKPTGTVTIADTTDNLSCSYSLGAATPGCTITPPSAGAKSLTVTYPGDTNFIGSAGTGSMTVGTAATGTALTSSINPSTFGQNVVFIATLASAAGAPTPTGTVNFSDGTTALCTNVALSLLGTATCAAPSLSVGSHSIQASYSGDTNTAASTGTLTQTVNAATTTMGLVATPSTLLSGQSLLLTATVSGNVSTPTSVGGTQAGAMARGPAVSAAGAAKGSASPAATTPTGTVTFLDGATTLGVSIVNAAGVATLSVSALSVGRHTLIADYAGDGSFAAATASATVTVNPSAPPVSAPTASTWMLTLLGLGLLGVGMRRARTRH